MLALLALALCPLFSAPAHAAPTNAPSITGGLLLSEISDEQNTAVFSGDSVNDGDSHGVGITITISPTSLGAFQASLPSGVTSLGGGVYNINFASQSTAQSKLGQLVFKPVPFSIPVPFSSNVNFSITATNVSGLSTNYSYNLQVDSTNHAPTISITGGTSFSLNDNANDQPFANVTVSDSDNGGSQQETVTISLGNTNDSILVGGIFNDNGDGTYTATGTSANITTAIHSLVFVPTPNQLPVGQKETNVLTIVADDTYNQATNSSLRVVVTSINDPPVVSGVSSTPQPVQTARSIQPFSGAGVTDVDRGTGTNGYTGQLLSLTVTMSGTNVAGTISVGGSSGVTSFSASGLTSGDVTSFLQGLAYTASGFPQTYTNVMSIQISVNDGFATTTTNAVVSVYTPVRPPGLSGTQSGLHVNDNSTIAPFSTVTLQSLNAGALGVVLQLDNDVKGQLINLGPFVRSNTSPEVSYVFSGTADAATAAIRQILFQPTPNRIPGNTNETTFFTILLIDGGVTNSPDSSTTVIVTPVNDPPVIQGTSPLVTIPDTGSQGPFPTVLITDVDELGQQQVTVTVSLDNSVKGTFSTNSLAVSGFANAGGGSYTFSGTPTNATTAIRQLVFTPTPGRIPVGLTENTTFNINVDDHQGGVVNNNNTVIRVAALSGGPVINVPQSQPVSLPLAAPLEPLGLVSISSQQNVTVTVLVTNSTWGSFDSNSVVANGFTNNAPGTYVFSGSANNATLSLGSLEFVPATNLVLGTVITYSITAKDQTGNSTTALLSVTLRQNQRTLIVTRTNDYDPTDALLSDAAKGGTLRKAVTDAGSNDHITFDLRSGVPGLPDYPAIIRLQSPLVLNKNVTIDGPGADLLTISGDTNADGNADVQLLIVNALANVNRLTFTKGHHSFAGGVAEVNVGGSLNMSYCAVTDSKSDVWGGGIDVNGGALNLDHCLIKGNSVGAAAGQGGGGISIYTDQQCTIQNTTFSGNRQLSPGGLGGGAMYVEDSDPGSELDVFLLGCTFSGNLDVTGQGSSIRPNVFNTVVQMQNSIVADGQGKNLEMDESGAVISLGGNISDDGTATIFSAGGAPVDTVIFDLPTDRTNTNPQLLTLSNNGGPTLTCALQTNSPALGNAASNTPASIFYGALATDQRGYFRDSAPDIGAYELNASQRIIIEEILFNPAAPNTNNQFIEFFVPHDSTALNLGGYIVAVNGVQEYTFAPQALNPGQALVLFSKGYTSPSVPAGVFMQVTSNNLALPTSSGTITLLNPSNQVVLSVNYLGSFASSDPNDPGYLNVTNQSVVLSPQFQGVYLPYQRVVAKEGGRVPTLLDDPGDDAGGNPLGGGNAPPVAYNDSVATDAATPLPAIPVLANDVDSDRTDTIRVVGVGVTNGLAAGVSGSNGFSAFGAALTVNNTPSAGASVSYDPTASALLRSLPPGSNVVDTFQYTILDSSNGVDNARGTTPTQISNNIVKATATVSVSITGVNFAPTPQDDGTNTNPNLTTSANAVLDFTTADNILANDTDPNSDDNSSTLTIVSIEGSNGYIPNSFQATSVLGASVTLIIRFDRNQTHVIYDPRNSAALMSLAQGQAANDTFYYTVMDRHGAVGTAAVHITVIGINNPPVANPDSFATDEDTAISIPVAALLANDTDPDTGITNPIIPHLTVSLPAAFSTQGAAVHVAGTNVIYDPTVSSNLNALARKESIVDTFQYTATDDFGGSSTTTVSVTVAGRNDPPIGANDFYTTGEKIPLLMSAPGVMANDHDPDVNGVPPDDSIRTIPFTNFMTAGGASVNLNADGSFRYDPHNSFAWLVQGQITTDTFSYVVMDHSLTIANDDAFLVQAGSSGVSLPVLANDALLSGVGGMLSVISVTTPTNGGTVSINGQGNALIYTPPVGTTTNDGFSYTISDGLGGTDFANVGISIVGSAPKANPDWFTVAKGTTANLNVLANDAILPASPASLSILSLGTPNHGGVVSLNGIGPSNLVTYTPGLTNTTPYVETFTYVLSAGGTLTATGTVSVTVIDRSNRLTANDDSFTVIGGSGNNSLDVLANDEILPGPNTNLTITGIQTNGVIGTVSINAAHNRLVYQPAPGVTNHQEPIVTYTISDGAGGTASANVSILVQPSGFFANADVFAVEKNSQNNALTVLANDIVLPNLGQTLTITTIGTGSNAPNAGGTVTINGLASGLIYTPASNFVGEESFTYEISSGGFTRAQGQVLVKVIDTATLNSNPDYYTVARDSANNTLAVLKNDYVMPKTPGAFTITGLETNGIHGTVSINGAGPDNVLVYSPKGGFIGPETFGYETIDGFGNKGTNFATVKVGNLVTQTSQFAVVSGSSSNSLNVLANDLLLPDALGVRAISGFGVLDRGGAVTTNGNGTMALYTPHAGFTGIEHFSYQMTDDGGAVVSGMATVQVVPVGSDRCTNLVSVTLVGTNDPPVIAGTQGGFGITDKQTLQPFTTVSITDADEYGLQTLAVTVSLDNAAKGVLQNLGAFISLAPGSYTMIGSPSNITAALKGLVFVPTANRIPVPNSEVTTFTISANDGYVASPVTDSTTTVNVTSVNDAPTITGTLSGQKVFDLLSLRPFAGVTVADVDNLGAQPLSATVSLDQSSHGFITTLGGFAGSNGVYSISNVTGAQITAALRGMVFVPTVSNRVSQGGSETTRLTIAVNDSFAPTVTDNTTTVTATDAFMNKTTNSDGTTADPFAASLGSSYNFVVAGTPYDSGAVTHSGSAYLYARNQGGQGAWGQFKKLVGTNSASAQDQFGCAVAISGNTIVVGALGASSNGVASGVAYIFEMNQGGSNVWGQVTRLVPPDGAAGDQFGQSVAIDGDTVVVGAHKNHVGAPRTGSAYVFGRNQGGTEQWGLVKKISASDGLDSDDFGCSVGISADTVVVGSQFNPSTGNKAGAAYVFGRNQGNPNAWGQVRKIVASDAAANAAFGHVVGISGDLVVSGAPSDVGNGTFCGSAYAFSRNQNGANLWGQVNKMVPADGGSGNQFGLAAGVDNGVAAVGSNGGSESLAQSGATYVYAGSVPGVTAWSLVRKIQPVLPDTFAQYGFAVALNQGTLAVDAHYNDGGGNRFALTYIYGLKFDNAPVLEQPIPAQSAITGVPFNSSVPAGTFADTDIGDSWTYSIGPVPAPPVWLGIDPVSGTFSGTPTTPGVFTVAVIATDLDGLSTTNLVTLTVTGPPAANVFALGAGMLSTGPAGENVGVVLAGPPGFSYTLQRTTLLQGANTVWTDVATGVTGTNGFIIFSDPAPPSPCFYRAKSP